VVLIIDNRGCTTVVLWVDGHQVRLLGLREQLTATALQVVGQSGLVNSQRAGLEKRRPTWFWLQPISKRPVPC
jgi:hypothetical protein